MSLLILIRAIISFITCEIGVVLYMNNDEKSSIETGNEVTIWQNCGIG